MSAWEGLRAGHLNRDGVAMLYEAVLSAALANNFPPPDEHVRWDAAAVHAAAHDFLVGRRGMERLVECALTADDDASLRRVLEQAMLNHLRDQGRATTVGKLLRRLRPLIDDDARFLTVPDREPGAGNVTLAAAEDPRQAKYGEDVFGGNDADLLSAAWKVRDVNLVRWRPDSAREPAPADAPSLLRVVEAVLDAARGSMRLADLAKVVAARFGLGAVPASISLDDLDGGWGELADDEAAVTRQLSPERRTIVEESAQTVFEQLTLAEQFVLAHWDSSLRVIADLTGMSKSTVGNVRSHLEATLSLALASDPEAAAVLARTRELAEAAHPLPL